MGPALLRAIIWCWLPHARIALGLGFTAHASHACTYQYSNLSLSVACLNSCVREYVTCLSNHLEMHEAV